MSSLIYCLLNTQNKVFEVMPDFAPRKSALEKKVKKANKSTDRPVWEKDTDAKVTSGS